MIKKLLIIPLGFLVLLYTLSGVYLAYGSQIPPAAYALLAIPLIFQPMLLPLAHALPVCRARKLIHRAAEATIGVYLYLLIVLCLLSTFCFLCLLTPLQVPPLWAVTSVALFFLGLVVAAGILNARRIKKVRYTLRLASKVPGHIRALVFSDLHLGFFTTKKFLRRLTEAVNGENADYIFFAGDLFDSDYDELRNEKYALESLRAMHASKGFYACAGNHDAYGENDDRQREFFSSAGIHLLRDEALCTPLFTLFGRKDRYKRDRVSAQKICALPHPLIVLDHQPDEIPLLLKLGADLVLCGHTHNGQTFPGNIALRLFNRYAYGMHREGQNRGVSLTTSGAGYWGIPLRLFTHNEIVLLDIFFG